jgi:hypothetical protein
MAHVAKIRFSSDIVHAKHTTRTVVMAFGIHLFTRIPYVITEHWSRYLPERNSYNGFFRRKNYRICGQHAAAVFPVSENLKKCNDCQQVMDKNYFVVNNAVDDVFLTDISKESETKKVILPVSCF